jgi:hypothetical protein
LDSASATNIVVNIASASGVTYVPGKKNGAASVSASGFLDLGDFTSRCAGALHLCSNGVTIAFWMKLTNVTGNTAEFLRSNIIYMKVAGTSYDIYLYNKGVAQEFHVNYAIPAEQWVHYTFTWHNPTNIMKLYFDGNLHATRSAVDFTPPPPAPYYVVMPGGSFTAILDEFLTFESFKDASFVELLPDA